MLRSFWDDRKGVVAIVFVLILVPLLLAVGAAIDYSYAYGSRERLQQSADAAVIVGAKLYTVGDDGSDLSTGILAFLVANDPEAGLDGDPEISADGSELCIVARATSPTSFMKIANINSLTLRTKACSILPGYANTEIALVLDVSSSMIEQARFTQMQDAAIKFVETVSAGTSASNIKISIVPFSSRVNIGLPKKSWLKAYGGNSAVPTRWTNPSSVHSSSSFTFSTWIDNATSLAYNHDSDNYYWMGCIEPRSDVEVKDNGALGSYGLTDDPPATSQFVAMDWNSQSSKSFCPPPITPLSSDYSYLKSAISNLTSEGSTRLDAGMIAGWYTLSPKWQSAWGSASAPADYSNTVQKFIVFMTDGEMNTQYGQKSGKLDWRCYKMQSTSTSSACNNAATSDMLTICSAMKSVGVKIYSIAYSKDADTDNIFSCSSGAGYYYSASTSASSSSYIETIYAKIAEEIRDSTVRLTQ
jgi:Flp pilus assembly protein TadG